MIRNPIPRRYADGTRWAVALALGFALAASAQSREIVFDSAQSTSEARLSLAELGSDLPSDWSGYEALVIEIRASSPQRWNLKIYSGEQGHFSRVLFHPYPGAWLRAAIPVALLSAAPTTGHDMASVGNRSRIGYYLGLWGPFVPLRSVSGIGFAMEHPVGSPKLEIRSIRLARTSPGDAVLEPLPVMDEFGQWIHADWPGKATSLDALKSAWDAEAEALKAAKPGYGHCKYGGYQSTQARATGFFRVERIEGKWWFVDPDGHLFLSVGSDVMRPEMGTPNNGRQSLFRQLPPASLTGSRAGSDPGASFYSWNLLRRFGDDWRQRWVALTLERMEAWGLNTIANWSHPDLWDRGVKPYVIPLARWETKVSYLGLPDVYADEFLANVEAAAQRQCEPRKNDPMLLGYFLANEPPFPQKEQQTAAMILSGPDTATQRALKQWLADGDTPARRKQFIDDAFDRYIEVTSRTVRKFDPNHLNLGMRSGGHPTEAELRVSRAFDVYSINVYDFQVSSNRMADIERLTGKPVLIGEFHFGVPGRGLAASLVQTKDQSERAAAYRYYVEQAFAMPALIGTHWFQWVDQPATGRSDGENYNIGLVDVTDRPYEEMVRALQTTHARLLEIHSGQLGPVTRRAETH